MERYYRFADITININGLTEQMYEDDGILAPFIVDKCNANQIIDIQMTDRLTAPTGECIYQDSSMRVYQDADAQIRYQGSVANGLDNAAIRIARKGNHSSVQVKREVYFTHLTPKTILNCMEAEHLIVCDHGLLLHASFVEYKGEGILFTAPSGTGKSTQADLWCRLRGARLVNGDRTAVRCKDELVFASGVPYAGSSGVCRNVTLPLRAIVYLSQAPKTQISRLKGLRSFRSVWEGCSVNIWNRQDMELCMQTVMETVKNVPVFHLACTPDETAVLALEHALEELR